MDPSSSFKKMSIGTDGRVRGQQQKHENGLNVPILNVPMSTSLTSHHFTGPNISFAIHCPNFTRLDSSQAPSGFLGGLPDDNGNKVSVDTFYGSLFRGPTSSLPGLHSNSKTFASKALQETFMKIYTGDFVMEWNEAGDDQDDEEKKRTLYVAVYGHRPRNEDANDEHVKPTSASSSSLPSSSSSSSSSSRLLLRGAPLLGVTFTATPEGKSRSMMHTLGGDTIPPPSSSSAGNNSWSGGSALFINSLTMNQSEALRERILHIFVRTFGAKTHETTYRGLIWFLQVMYTKKGYWKEDVDLAIIAADISFNTPGRNMSKDIAADLDRVAKTLESDGRVREAATLYEEISAKFCNSKDRSNARNRSLVCNDASIAYMNAEKFKDAERMLVFALHYILASTGGSWDLTDSATKTTFHNMVAVYLQWKIKEGHDGGTTEADATFETAFRILAHSAGIDYSDDYDECMGLTLLKPKYMRQKVAHSCICGEIPKNHSRMCEVEWQDQLPCSSQGQHCRHASRPERSCESSKQTPF